MAASNSTADTSLQSPDTLKLADSTVETHSQQPLEPQTQGHLESARNKSIQPAIAAAAVAATTTATATTTSHKRAITYTNNTNRRACQLEESPTQSDINPPPETSSAPELPASNKSDSAISSSSEPSEPISSPSGSLYEPDNVSPVSITESGSLGCSVSSDSKTDSIEDCNHAECIRKGQKGPHLDEGAVCSDSKEDECSETESSASEGVSSRSSAQGDHLQPVNQSVSTTSCLQHRPADSKFGYCDAYYARVAYDRQQLNPYLNQYLATNQHHMPLMVQLSPPPHLYSAHYARPPEHLVANYCTLLPYAPQPAIYTALPHTYPYHHQHQYQQPPVFLLPAPPHLQQQHHHPNSSSNNNHHHHHHCQPAAGLVNQSGLAEEHYQNQQHEYPDPSALYSPQLALIHGQLVPQRGPPVVPYYMSAGSRSQLPGMAPVTLQAQQPFVQPSTLIYAESPLNVPDPSTLAFFEDPTGVASTNSHNGPSMMAFSQLKLGYNLIPKLPIDAQPAQMRQAYGMDKVWNEEFEQLFSQFVSSIVWTLIEVEFNPSIVDCGSIIGYRGRYLIQTAASNSQASSVNEDVEDSASVVEPEERYSIERKIATSCHEDCEEVQDDGSDSISVSSDQCHSESTSQIYTPPHVEACGETKLNETESDCDSGAQVNSTSGSSEPSTESSSIKEGTSRTTTAEEKGADESERPVRRFPTRFRMFIDSAKVRFSCDHCGHGWTSMKGRVVFWYELFELVDLPEDLAVGGHNLIGYCAYKLFGQQCDVCKIENRFERPMWYPEEVTKVLNNLYNKIGQVYFGFKMPAIDKQRRAGKPRTSHNSSLCQACHDGVCTDRK